MFWAVPGHEPDYVDALSAAETREEVDNHIKYMTGITRGKLGHWDVNNELLHGNYYEEKTNDPDFTKQMFQKVHAEDPTPKLFLNDYGAVAKGSSTYAYLRLIQDFKEANVGLGGVGVQSHVPDFTEPDPTLMKYRLDTLAQAGVPIWVTELDVVTQDEIARADWYEKALRLYFSHPAVYGVIIWGFWDHDQEPNQVLVHGYTFNLAEAGKRFLHLTQQEWSTHVNESLASSTSLNVRGFKGVYDLTVWYKGKPIKHRTLTLDDSDKNLTIGIYGDGSEIELPAKVDPFESVEIADQHDTTSEGLRTLGQASTSHRRTRLTCTNRNSETSVVGEDSYVEVTCRDLEVLTGCSSIMVNNDWRRKGEQIVMVNDKPTCRAADGYLATAGVQAQARCCTRRDLTCTYRTAGPSGSGIDDQVVAPCPVGTYPLGCSTWATTSHSDGSYFTNTSCISQNDDPKTGVKSFAACCSGLRGQCRTVYSQTSGQAIGDKATITCPAGTVMTGCNVFSNYARAAGAEITTSRGVTSCNAINGFARYGSELGVQAIATCCPR
ncbi:endo-1,4-beta-xylanase [Elysia marginata]|uniref:Endo-1,4-beta-xylanase n=1 Tax=Elysia marginata TaxID=1093978 RepID=A0AAV4EKA6_9GAST|nr:endo-1,4-beta-xylanase [Elysia marginata]